MKKKKKNKKNNIKILIGIIILIIFIIFIYGIQLLFSNKSTNDLLIDKSKDIVYTSYENTEYEKEVPSLNIINISDEVNNSINEFVKSYISKKANRISYHYQINGNILSLFTIIEDFQVEGSADVHYLSYIIDLKKLKILTNKEILDMFQTDEGSLIEVLNNNFKSYYETEKNKKIIPIDMSYEEYLTSHEITNFSDQMYYDISDSKLKIYLDYNQWTSYETENYLTNVGYIFEFE